MNWLRAIACTLLLAYLAPPRSHDVYLIPDAPARREAAPDRTYLAASGSTQFVHLTVGQHDLDASIEYRVRGTSAWRHVDCWDHGDETVSTVIPAEGVVEFHVHVRLSHAPGAFYTVRIANSRLPAAAELLRTEAEHTASAVKAALDNGSDPVRWLDASARVIGLWKRLKEPVLEGSAVIARGNVLFASGRISEAHVAYAGAEELSSRNQDTPNLAESANDAGYCELLLGQLTASKEHLSRALKIWEEAGSSYGRETALNNIGLAAWQTGDFGGARRAYRSALALVDPRDYRARGLIANNTGLIFLSLGDYRQAVSSLRESLNLLPQSDTTARARTMINLGRAYRLSGEVQISIDWLHRALPLAGKSSDPRVLAETLNNLGQALLTAGEPAAAETSLRQALGIYRRVSARRGVASTLHSLGLARLAVHDSGGALNYLQVALRLRQQSGLRDDVADTLAAIARVHSERGELSEADTYAARAVETIESLRGGLPGEQFRISYFAVRQTFYEFYIDLLMRRHRIDPARGFDRKAFDIAEHARGRAMLEILREAEAGITRGVDASLLNQERTQRESIGFLSRKLSLLEDNRHTPETEAELRARLETAVNSYRDIEAEIKDKSPDYAHLIFPQPHTLKQIRSGALTANTSLLEFSAGDDRSYLWLITQDSFTTYDLPGLSVIRPLCDSVRAAAADYRGRIRNGEAQRQYRESVRELSKLLLGQAAHNLRGRRLIIVTPGLLQEVPFAALSISGGDGPDPAPLGVTNELVRMTSASAFLEISEMHLGAATGQGVAVFADPVLDRTDHRLPEKIRRAATGPGSLARLPFSGQEADEILRLIPSDNNLRAVGFAASRVNLFQPRIGSFRYIHFATHALIDPTPELSGIALSRWAENGDSAEGFVRTLDIYNLPGLSCSLVVLAGCDTGSGTEVSGEGVIGLLRGFLYAGARSVLVNLWSLEDAPSTVEWMRILYTNMAIRGMTPSAALRATREELWNLGGRWRDDYFQAGFELYGESGS